MKVIKFRQPVFNSLGQFDYWHYWGWIKEGVFISPLSIGHRVNGELGQQNTDMKDRNGVEVYEGDIVKTAYRTTVDGEYDGQYMGTIEYDRSSFDIWWYGNDPDANLFDLCYKNRIEVIGNVYQHPELLK